MTNEAEEREWFECWCGYGTTSDRNYAKHGDEHMQREARAESPVSAPTPELRSRIAEKWKVVPGQEADDWGISRESTPAPFMDVAQMVGEDDAREIVNLHNAAPVSAEQPTKPEEFSSLADYVCASNKKVRIASGREAAEQEQNKADTSASRSGSGLVPPSLRNEPLAAPSVASEDAATPDTIPQPKKAYRDGEPCSHPGCLRHLSHPCEECGRIGGRYPDGSEDSATQPTKRYLRCRKCGYTYEGWSAVPHVVCLNRACMNDKLEEYIDGKWILPHPLLRSSSEYWIRKAAEEYLPSVCDNPDCAECKDDIEKLIAIIAKHFAASQLSTEKKWKGLRQAPEGK